LVGTGTFYFGPTHENLGLGRIFRIKERYELNLRIEFNNVFNRAEMPIPTSTNAAQTQVTNKSGVPTAGFGFIATGNTGIVTNTQTPRARAR
jgi:hypothetical protein